VTHVCLHVQIKPTRGALDSGETGQTCSAAPVPLGLRLISKQGSAFSLRKRTNRLLRTGAKDSTKLKADR